MANPPPVVRALLMTTAVAWSIGVRLPDAESAPGSLASRSDDSGGAQRRHGQRVLPFRQPGAKSDRPAPRLPNADAA